jgi:5-methylcytosine-specific restriction endonuclease McrA
LDSFYREPRAPDGRYARCKSCHQLATVSWRNRNLEKTNQDAALWRARHQERSRSTQRKHANTDKRRAQRRQWRTDNHDTELAKERNRQRSFRKNSPERHRALKLKRRALKVAAQGHHTAEQLKDLYRKQHGNCAICLIKLNGKYDADHIVALSRGGSNFISNIQLLCAPCNRSKRDKDPIEYRQQRGFLL